MVAKFISSLAQKLRAKKLPQNYSDSNNFQLEHLLQSLLGHTAMSSAGFPVVSQQSFECFLNKVPHLFSAGQQILDVLTLLESMIASNEMKTWWESEALKEPLLTTTEPSICPKFQTQFQHKDEIHYLEDASPHSWDQDLIDLKKSIKVIRNAVFTAGVTAPSDLWLLKHVLSSFKHLKILDTLINYKEIKFSSLVDKLSIEPEQFRSDLHFLKSRKILKSNDDETFYLAESKVTQDLIQNIKALDKSQNREWISVLTDCIDRKCLTNEASKMLCLNLDKLRNFPPNQTDSPSPQWSPSLFQVEVGYRLLPMVLALRSLGLTKDIKQNDPLDQKLPLWSPKLASLFNHSGLIDANNCVTELGARVFQRGPGPFGIIHAYHGYMTHHLPLLKGKKDNLWVARGENVAASQDANARTFKMIHDSLDQFMQDHSFYFDVFIEHAVGQGEATRQRFERNGESKIQYFGADLEDDAINRAKIDQASGLLPNNMKFIHNADIGKPKTLIDGVEAAGFSTQNSVMVVGNGFHEVRNQSNEKMIQVFKDYFNAGIIIIFTEESGLTDDDLIQTGWNTYHAGFRYLHAISGQGLRPSIDTNQKNITNHSWRKCAALGGYEVLDRYSSQTRTIFPYPKPDGYNPSISVNYFCCLPKNTRDK